MAANLGSPPLPDRVVIADRPDSPRVQTDPTRLLSLVSLALRLAREDLAAQGDGTKDAAQPQPVSTR